MLTNNQKVGIGIVIVICIGAALYFAFGPAENSSAPAENPYHGGGSGGSNGGNSGGGGGSGGGGSGGGGSGGGGGGGDPPYTVDPTGPTTKDPDDTKPPGHVDHPTAWIRFYAKGAVPQLYTFQWQDLPKVICSQKHNAPSECADLPHACNSEAFCGTNLTSNVHYDKFRPISHVWDSVNARSIEVKGVTSYSTSPGLELKFFFLMPGNVHTCRSSSGFPNPDKSTFGKGDFAFNEDESISMYENGVRIVACEYTG